VDFFGFEDGFRSIASNKIDADNLRLHCRKDVNDQTGRTMKPYSQTVKGKKELKKSDHLLI
jgi:hypothetical protein